MGSTYTGSTAIADATDITGSSFPIQFATGQANPSGAQDYTIRVFSDSTACGGVCFMDYTLTMYEQDCAIGCACTEYLYVNDVDLDLTHKFEVNSSTRACTFPRNLIVFPSLVLTFNPQLTETIFPLSLGATLSPNSLPCLNDLNG